MSKIESQAAPVYQTLSEGRQPTSDAERADLARFFALLYCRTTAMRRMAAQVHGQSAQILHFAYASDPEAFEALTRRAEAAKGGPIDPAVKEEIRQRMLNPTGYVMEIPQQRTLGVLKIADALTRCFRR
ncbi:hypothetical protein ACVIGA_002299 [Bradyrhizobium sp. USDA 3240]